jgi:hypothetical protein
MCEFMGRVLLREVLQWFDATDGALGARLSCPSMQLTCMDNKREQLFVARAPHGTPSPQVPTGWLTGRGGHRLC